MAGFDYQIGGNERELSSAAGFADIPKNKTLFVSQLSSEPADSPEMVKDLTSTKDVFEHFRPNVEVNFTDAEGNEKPETLDFRGIADFGPDGLSANSQQLKALKARQETFMRIAGELEKNSRLQKMLQDPETKAALLDTLQSLSAELAAANQ